MAAAMHRIGQVPFRYIDAIRQDCVPVQLKRELSAEEEAAAPSRALREAHVAWAAAMQEHEEEAAAHQMALREAEVAWAAATKGGLGAYSKVRKILTESGPMEVYASSVSEGLLFD